MDQKRCYSCMKLKKETVCEHCGFDENAQNMSHQLAMGTVLKEQYVIGRVLGQGGFGITYMGLDMYLDIPVAIKEYFPAGAVMRNRSVSSDVVSCSENAEARFENNRERFMREVKTLARFSDVKEIVQVKNFFRANNTAYIVMEYVEGTTLKQYVHDWGGSLSAEETFRILRPLMEALVKVHKAGLVHRDISPDNIMMLPDGSIKLLDFGAVRDVGFDAAADKPLTKSTEAILKQGYAPIEQYQNRGSLGPWTDVYALCATIYYCLTGEAPPSATERLLDEKEIDFSKKGVLLTAQQEEGLHNGLALRAQDRIPDMEQLCGQLFVKSDGMEECQIPAEEEGDWNFEEIRNTEKGFRREYTDSGNITKRRERQKKDRAGEKNGLRAPKHIAVIGIIIAVCVIAAIIVIVTAYMGEKDSADNAFSAEQETTVISDEVFANAYILQEDDSLAECLADKNVKAVIIPAGMEYASKEYLTITKPVLVENGASMASPYLTVEENGEIQVAGRLDAVNAIVKMEGQGTRLTVSDCGEMLCDQAVIWSEDKSNLSISENAAADLDTARCFVFSEEEIFAGAVSVTTAADLKNAAEVNAVISIDADMEMSTDVGFSAPVRISEGVTVNVVNSNLGLDTNNILINHGTLNSGITSFEDSNAVVINQGTMGIQAGLDQSCSLWMEGQSLFLNLGTVTAGDCSRMWDESRFVNAGTLNCVNFYLVGGSMVNAGQVNLEKDCWDALRIENDSVLRNSGTLTVASGAVFENDGWICNTGEFIVENNGIFYNAVLKNDGHFEADYGADLGSERYAQSGIYFGKGEFDLGIADISVHTLNEDLTGNPESAQSVSTAEELKAAMADDQVRAVYIESDIFMQEDLEVTKDLHITGALVMEGDAGLRAQEADIYVTCDGKMQGNHISILQSAGCFLQNGAELIINAGGTMTIDEKSFLCGEDEIVVQMEQVELKIENESGMAFRGGTLAMDESDVTLSAESVFVPVTESAWTVNGALFRMEDYSRMFLGKNTEMDNCILSVGVNAALINVAEYWTLRSSQISIAETGMLHSGFSTVSMISDTNVTNEGDMVIGGWDDYKYILHGTLLNQGRTDLNINVEVDGSTRIDNPGELHLTEEHGDTDLDSVKSRISGNNPIVNEF